jgi:two-component system NtrC family sensor kinase
MTMATGDSAAQVRRPGRALVVDDEPEIRETLAEILELDGFQVDLAENGFGALQQAEAGDYDLVVSDINMPGMDGMELYHRLRRQRPELAASFVVVTGNLTSNAVRLFLDETRVPQIAKPFRPAEVRKIASAARRQR